jgi:malate dehydrogenase (oxaloacetate-decarboxylating)
VRSKRPARREGERGSSPRAGRLLAFPGVFRGALDSGAQVINEEMKVAAAMTLAAIVIEPAPERILPDPLNKSVGFRIGEAVAAAARKSGVCRN